MTPEIDYLAGLAIAALARKWGTSYVEACERIVFALARFDDGEIDAALRAAQLLN